MTAATGVEPGVYTVSETAAKFRVAAGTIREQIRRAEHPFDGTIRVTRLGRRILVSRADLDRYLAPQAP